MTDNIATYDIQQTHHSLCLPHNLLLAWNG